MKLITIHGIRRQNRWHESLGALQEIRDYGIELLEFDYGYFAIIDFINKTRRQEIIDKFCNFYSDNIKTGSLLPSVIAHSFGTYVVFQAMKRHNVIKFDKIVFCGSILNESTDFRELIKNKQFSKLKNDHGLLDGVLKFTRFLIDKDCGQAGRFGFSDIPADAKDSIENVKNYKSHSDYFLPKHMQNNWLSFLTEGLLKFDYNYEILKPSIIDRIYENIKDSSEELSINSVKFSVRIDAKGNYFAKYEKEGINNNAYKTIDISKFATTADGFHKADVMALSVYDKSGSRLNTSIIKDINNKKIFKIFLNAPVRYKENFYVKYYFCWYNTINLQDGDTDHWSIYNITNINICINFPQQLINPKVFIVNNHRIVGQYYVTSKAENDSTTSYLFEFLNSNNDEGMIFYFEGVIESNSHSEKKNKPLEFSVNGKSDKYNILKAAASDIKKIYRIESAIDHSNAATENTLNERMSTFNDGFLVVKQKRTGQPIAYLESVIWTNKTFKTFNEISNFPLYYNVNGNVLYIIFVAVDKLHRKKGIARKMLEEIEKVAKKYRLQTIQLVAKDQLVNLYEKCGYKHIKELPDFLDGREYKSVLMEKAL